MSLNDLNNDGVEAGPDRHSGMGNVSFYLMAAIMAVVVIAIYGGAAYLIIHRLYVAHWWTAFF